MNVEQDIEMSTDEALVSALTPKQVGDIELQPFSLMRYTIAITLCRGTEWSFFNAIMTAWLCTLKELEALRMTKDIEQAQLSAFKWAEAQGYSPGNYQPLLDAYRQLNRELAAATGARSKAGDDGDAPKNVGGQPRP